MLVCEEYQAAESQWRYARSPSLASLPDGFYWPRAKAGAHVAGEAGAGCKHMANYGHSNCQRVVAMVHSCARSTLCLDSHP